MSDRKLPYARTLAVLRVLAWPYRFPPLIWLVALNSWLSATPRRMAATMVVCVAVLVWAVIAHG